MDRNKKDLVLVTGAAGYLASHVIQQLLESGYRVRGTVRNLTEEKARSLHSLCPHGKHLLELVEADLLNPKVWPGVVKDCKYVLLIATAQPDTKPHGKDAQTGSHGEKQEKEKDKDKDREKEKKEKLKEEELTKAAVEGTLNVLRAVVENDVGVSRVVLTSSLSAVASHGGNSQPFTEFDWPRLDDPAVLPRAKAKIMAERAAWDFVKMLPHGKKFDLTVLNPAEMMGPARHQHHGPATELLCQLLERKVSSVPAFILPCVDVRDVAGAHLVSMTNVDAIGQRHILYADSMWIRYIAELLDVEFGPQAAGYTIPKSQAMGIVTTVSSWFDHSIRENKLVASQPMLVDNARMCKVLGIEPIDLKTSIIDMAYSLIENGFVKKTDKYKGPHNAKSY